jgi:hypothetical protein
MPVRLALAVLLVSCSGSSPETVTVSPAGGESRTADGALRLVAPAGAVAAETRLTVQRVASPAAGNLGPVFELSPEATFAAAVMVVLRVDDADREGRPFATLRAAIVDATDHWMTLATPSFSEGQGTVSGSTTRSGTFGVVALPPARDAGVVDSGSPNDARPADAR